MQAVVLAGGEGKRIYPLFAGRPKPMFKIIGKPIIEWTILNAKNAGINDFVIVIGKNGEEIKNHFENGKKFGVKIKYALQEEPLGMANALQSAEEFLDEHFLVINADDVIEKEAYELTINEFEETGADIILCAREVEETWKYGILGLDENGFVKRIIEKPKKGEEPSNYAVISPYLMTKEIFEYYKKIQVSDHQYEDAIQAFIDDHGKVRYVIYNGFFSSFKFPWDLFRINKFLMDNFMEPKISEEAKITESAKIEDKVFIADGVRVLENATIRGPCFIDENSIIGNNALIRNYTSIGKKCVVGFSTEITNSIICDGCWFHTNYIGDSIVDENCAFGSGAVTANLRFDEENVKVKIGDKIIDTGLQKLGVIMARNCRVGINACLMPGIKIGQNSAIGPGVVIYEDLPENKIILKKKECNEVIDNKYFFGDREERIKKFSKEIK
ncbi:MAG: sugar phosphate nucleotidyltransferase [Candidatus Parvarchaeota archaeon]|nr:sugar phosphate nucleotidyltransferase [Candidatus Jingweiarchaeum tengchongense]MCW1298513.1 sugar phosphate nucleotidyltransferase [Candidatus Jingweiarchaeum tengchongense]MCW1300241.1 sugar phosphate nucleotidyltransferase [Candidatus Jingweiarchaeum tengchongense]MCW1304525.1 sugar phosphate nucleotidyltransferase [Candidatus Jingweiarchaeum tengchongense]MCW1305747.1 sugar phosphate nucleotidyltransferase [Candidatus Jingweiarchaeum tengchongense]